jgi:glutathione-regulated potassium-efflux system ancillary protein KefG
VPRVLIQFAHPVLERSRVNRRLVHSLRDLKDVTVNDLYEEYPTLGIDVRREQKLMVEHDVIVFQHPFYWYSAPAIVKEWQDLVLEHKWAYGAGGDKLKGKTTLNAITTGGPELAYNATGYNRFTMRELLAPFEQTARLCGMHYLAPFVVHASLQYNSDEGLASHIGEFKKLIEALRDGKVNIAAAEQAARINDKLDGLLTGGPQ